MNRERLQELVEAWRDSALTEEQARELNAELRQSADARKFFSAETRMHGLLHGAVMAASVETAAQTLSPDTKRTLIPFPIRRQWLAVAAAVVLVATGVAFLLQQRWASLRLGAVVASVARSSGAELVLRGGKAVSSTDGALLHSAPYELRGGFMELAYTNGATVLIEAPATFELRSASVLLLHTGNLSAQVPATAVGFTVETPTAKVVDLGTEFGVSANANASEVHVFKGEVLVTTAGANEPQRITERHASRIDAATGTPAGIECSPQNFMRSLEEVAGMFAQQVRQWQPVAYYRMRTTTDGTLMKDVANGHHDGQVVWGRSRSPWAPGKIGAALRLEGVEAGTYAVVPSLPKATNGALSVCAWVLAESRPRWASIAKNWAKDAGNNLGGQFHFGLWLDEGSLEVHVHDRAGNQVGVREQRPLPLAEWQFVAFTLDGSTLRLYRNGVEVAATPCDGLSTIGPSALGVGVKLGATERQPEFNTPGFWDGRIDELAIFHRALTAEQIRNLYDMAPAKSGGSY